MVKTIEVLFAIFCISIVTTNISADNSELTSEDPESLNNVLTRELFRRFKRSLVGNGGRAGAEYVFFLMFFGIIRRGAQEYDALGENFVTEVYNNADEFPNARDPDIGVALNRMLSGDGLFNGRARTIDWSNVWSEFTGYTNVLQSFATMITPTVNRGRVTYDEIKTLRDIVQVVKSYRQSANEGKLNPNHKYTLDQWQKVLDKLNELLDSLHLQRRSDDKCNSITLYENINHEGDSEYLHFNATTLVTFNRLQFSGYDVKPRAPRDCFNLPWTFRNKASSINTGGECVILYYNADCAGYFRVFTPGSIGHFNFKRLGFNDVAESIEYC